MRKKKKGKKKERRKGKAYIKNYFKIGNKYGLGEGKDVAWWLGGLGGKRVC